MNETAFEPPHMRDKTHFLRANAAHDVFPDIRKHKHPFNSPHPRWLNSIQTIEDRHQQPSIGAKAWLNLTNKLNGISNNGISTTCRNLISKGRAE